MQRRLPILWAQLQPDWMDERCGEHTMRLLGGRLSLRNPWLLPSQLLGVVVGSVGAARLLRLRPLRLRYASAYLAHALLFFCGMNLTSVAAHALLPRGSVSWVVFACLDVAFTGSASAAVIMAAILPPPASATGAAAAAVRCAHALVLALSLSAAGAVLQLPWVPEAVYLGTTVLAVVTTAHAKLLPEAGALLQELLAGRESKAGDGRRPRVAALAVGAGGAALMLACLPLDAWLCATFGHPALSTVPLLFLGSDLAFLALVLLALAGAQGPARRAQAAARGSTRRS